MAEASSESSVKVMNDIEWKDECLSLTDIKDDLPKICKYDGQLPPGLRLYSHQPVLLYKCYQKRKGYVRTIYRDHAGPFYEVGQTLQIPDDFEGWFELVPPDYGRGRYCETIEDLAKGIAQTFFTKTNLTGIRVDSSENDEHAYFQRKIAAGTVLKIKSAFNAKWRTCVEKGLRKKKQKEWITSDIQYLKCIDCEDQEVLIPYSARGKFHPVYQSGNNDSKCVFRMKDILSDLTLPVKVRLIYGKPPVVPCIFTGMLVVKDCKTEDVIVGSTITFRRHALFELPVTGDTAVYIPKSESIFENMKSYKDAIKLCEKYSDSYSSLIKLSPELDTQQQMIQHIPTEKYNLRNDSLKTLDLITNISLTDDEPHLMESSSDTASEQSLTMGTLVELKELKRPSSMMC